MLTRNERIIVMSKERQKEDMKAVAESCSQFSPIAAMTSSTGENVCTCEICKKWDGRRCSIGLYDVIADQKNLR